jgi:hypothetical protein
VLEGLLYLHHERHVIHRDIKPSNLLVNCKGEVKITDFGVSAVLASSMGQRDTFVGTYNYMAVCYINYLILVIPSLCSFLSRMCIYVVTVLYCSSFSLRGLVEALMITRVTYGV